MSERRASLSPLERAERSAAAMWEKDAAVRALGLRLEAVGPGTARFAFEVQPQHANGHAICHGGYIFTLADTAFAYACNSYNRAAVAQHNTISFIAPARAGDVLTAEAVETSLTGRSGVYDVTVRNGAGEVVALMRGCSRTIRGVHFEEG